MTIRLYDLMGVTGAPVPDEAAAALWPSHLIQGSIGQRDKVDIEEARTQVKELDATLSFQNIRPGVSLTSGDTDSIDLDRVGLMAELLVGAVPPSLPLVLTAMPDVAFFLQPTGSFPARVAITVSELGSELILEALPVEIKLPKGFIVPLGPLKNQTPPADEVQIDSWASGHHDTLRVILRATQPSSIFVHVKIRMTEDGRFVLEPAVPLSVGPCRFMGLPCRAIHDLNIVFSPKLGIGEPELDHYGDQALEWIRHPLVDDSDDDFGVFTLRTLDLDETRSPLSALHAALNPEGDKDRRFEWVFEDLAFPVNRYVPLPSHFLAGLRRELGPTDDPNGAYNLGGLAIALKGPARILQADYLLIEQLLFRSVPGADIHATAGDRQMAFVQLALTNDPGGQGHGATIELTDEWTVSAGWRNQPGIDLLKLFGAQLRLLGASVGLSIERLAGDKNVYESGLLVGDLEIELVGKGASGDGKAGVASLNSETKAPKGVVVHDFGLRFGSFTMGSFWKTGGASLRAFDIIKLEIEEFGLVTEPSGALYFSFSGSIPLPVARDAGNPVTTGSSTNPGGKIQDGVGFRFYRLRGKIAGPEEAPFILIDGVGLSIRYGKVGITGFGMLSETVRDGHRYKEAGLSIELRIGFAEKEFLIGGSFFHGKVTGPVHNFSYGMAGAAVSPIPISAIELINVRLLFAWNMTPQLGPVAAGSASTMRLYQWYEAHRSGVALPASRNLGLTGWTPEEDAWTIAAGAGMSISRAITMDAFFMYLSSGAGRGLLAGMKIFLFKSGEKSNKPIGFAVFEIDGDRWSVSAGISIGTKNVIGKEVPLLKDSPFLTGTFYHTNKPATTAIGQFSDPTTWLAVNIGGGAFDLFTIEVFAGMCLQVVDLPEGPRVFSTRLSVSGGSRLFKIGGIDFYLTFQVTAGVWRTESRVSGWVAFLEGGLHIDFLYVFNFGADARVQVDYLGPDPVFRRFAFEVRIDTPWWLPDKTFRWNRQTGEAEMNRMNVISTPVIEAAAIQLSSPEPVDLKALAPVVGASIDREALYNINDLSAATGFVPAQDIEPISVDSSLSLSFNVSVDDRLVFGLNTVAGVGSDRSADVSTVYELVEFGIRRRPKGATDWSFLIDPAISRMESLAGLPADVIEQRRRQKVRLRWDADFQRESKLDPRRLLINTDTPFLMVAVNLEGDEALVRNMPAWPCCPGTDTKPVWHVLNFREVAHGTRVPAVHNFSDSSSTLSWSGMPPPVAGPGRAAAGAPTVARQNADTTPAGLFASAFFVEIAQIVEIRLVWRPLHLNRTLLCRALSGLKVVDERRFDLSAPSLPVIAFDHSEGISEIQFLLEGEATTLPENSFGWLEWVEMRFRSVREVQTELLEQVRCNDDDGPSKPGGRFAWLPDHEYEIVWKTRVTAGHDSQGQLQRELTQTLRFNTKDLPGTNLAERHGMEFEPYVEAEYPGPDNLIYRREPALLALNEKSDIFRIPSSPHPGDPAERRQQTDWQLVVNRVGGLGPVERISQPGEDWIVANRGTALPTGPVRPPVDAGEVTAVLMRSTASLDPLWQRFERVRASPFSCNQPADEPPSRVLVHQPYDPDPDAPEDAWPARSVLRAGVQIKRKPFTGPQPFVHRSPFVAGDETALTTIPSGLWRIENNAIGPATDTGATTSIAIFGENNWRNFVVSALIHPNGGEAGIAVEVAGQPEGEDALLITIHENSNQLRVQQRIAGDQSLLNSVLLPESLAAPFMLEVNAYTDAWQVAVGETGLTLNRNIHNQGKLGLSVQGSGRFSALRVEPLDVYRFEFETSRFVDFDAHIKSWNKVVDVLPDTLPSASAAELVTNTPVSLLMQPGSDPHTRQRAFDQWSAALGVMLRTQLETLKINRPPGGMNVDYLLLESPEPIRFTDEVSLKLRTSDSLAAEIPLSILSDGSQKRAFIVTLSAVDGTPAPLTPGSYELDWTIDRIRYRASSADPQQRFQQNVVTQLIIA